MFKKKFYLREEAADGGGGGTSTEVIDQEEQKPLDFSTAFTDDDDKDDFDLGALKDKVEEKTPEEKRILDEGEEKTPEEIAEEDRIAKVNEGKTPEEIAAAAKIVEDVKLKKDQEKEIKDNEEKEIINLEKTLKEEGKTEEEIKTAVEGKKEEFEIERNKLDPFSALEETDDSDINLSTPVDIDFNSVITDMELSVEEGVEIKTMDEFKEIVKTNLKKAKSTVDTSEFPPEAKMLWDNIIKNKNLTVTDFYRNETIKGLDAFLNNPDDVKIKRVLAQELKDTVNQENMADAVEDKFLEMTDDEISEKVKEINRNVSTVKTKEFNKIIAEKNKFIESQNVKAEKTAEIQRETLAKSIESLEEYMGFPIPESARKIMAKEARNGKMQKFLDENIVQTKISAYIGTKLGKQFAEAYKKSLTKKTNEAYANGTKTVKSIKHNIDTGGGQQSSNKGRKSGDMSFDSSHFKEED